MAGDNITVNILKFKGKGDYKLWRIKILLVLDKENISSILDDELVKSVIPVQISDEQNITFALKIITHL